MSWKLYPRYNIKNCVCGFQLPEMVGPYTFTRSDVYHRTHPWLQVGCVGCIWEFEWIMSGCRGWHERSQKSACLQKRFCSCNMNGLSCTEACTCMAYDNKCQNPHKDSPNDAIGGDDDEDEDPSEIWINNIMLSQLSSNDISLFIMTWRPSWYNYT